MSEPRPEQQPPLHTVSEVVLDALACQPVSADYPIMYADDIGEIRRLYVVPEQVLGVGSAELTIDHRHYFQKWPNDFDMVDFQYNRGETPVATMQFQFMPDGSYGLSHRYVQPDFRKRGVGERLLAQAEQAFQQSANREQKDITIFIQVGQRSVLRWFLKNGYEPKDDRSADLVQAVLHQPEQFIFAEITDKDALVKDDCIFEPGTTGRTLEDTVRINLQKVISPEVTVNS